MLQETGWKNRPEAPKILYHIISALRSHTDGGW
jgi:hypothetical protein